MATESTVRLIFLGDSARAVRSVNTLGSSFSSLGHAAKLAAGVLAVGIVGGMAAATKQAIQFDRSMRNVNSIAHLSEGQLKLLSKQVLALSKVTGKGPKDLADGLYDIVSSGFKAKDAVTILAASAKAATAGMTNTATATKAVVAVLNAYHLSARDATKVSNTLFQEVNLGVNTFEELAQNIGDTAPQAAALKIPFSDISAALATITLHGTSMAEASTQVSRVLTALVKPTKDLSAEFKSMGYESGQAAVQALGFSGLIRRLSDDAGGNQAKLAAWLGDIRGIRGVLNLTGANLQSFTDNVRKMGAAQQGAGATQRAFAEQAKSIGFQWDRAKASLEAAAVPIGQLLFPLLAKGATKVGDFAQAVETHMPQIRAQFQQVGQAAGEVAHGLGLIARSSEGQAVLVGLLSAAGASGAIGKFKSLAAGIGGLSSPAGLAAAGIGILAGGLFYAATRANHLEVALASLKSALGGLSSAQDQHAQAVLRATAADHQAEASTLGLSAARRLAANALRQYGKDSEQYKQALVGMKEAEDAVKQTLFDRRQAHKDVQRTAQTEADISQQVANATRKTYVAAEAAIKKAAESVYSTSRETEANVAPVRAALDNLATGIHNAEKAAGEARGTTNLYVAAVRALFQELGRLPTLKEVRIRVIQENRVIGARLTRGASVGTGIGRATGGFIPKLPGSVAGADSVPAMLTPGEVVLNRSQQDALGGPGFFKHMFGFTGGEGPGFAAGGIVPPGAHGRGSHRAAPNRRGTANKLRAVTAAGKAAFAAVSAVQQRESDLQQAYDLLGRAYSIEQTYHPVVVTDAQGNQSIDQSELAKQLGEIDGLIASRNQMLGLVGQEKARLQEAIEALKRAVAALLKAIAEARAAAQHEAEQVAGLQREIAQISRDESAEQHRYSQLTSTKMTSAQRAAARKQHDSILYGLRQRRTTAQAGVKRLTGARQAHLQQATTWGSQLGGLRTDMSSAQQTLDHDLAFRRQGYVLDITDLQGQRAQLADTSVSAPTAAGPDLGSSVGTDTGAGGIGILAGPDRTAGLQATIDDLRQQLARFGLALGIQNVQVPIIGSFQKGGEVHMTGTALVHQGEYVLPAGTWRTGPGAAAPSALNVNVIMEGDAAGLERFVKLKAVESWPQVSAAQGRSAERLRREARY